MPAPRLKEEASVAGEPRCHCDSSGDTLELYEDEQGLDGRDDPCDENYIDETALNQQSTKGRKYTADEMRMLLQLRHQNCFSAENRCECKQAKKASARNNERIHALALPRHRREKYVPPPRVSSSEDCDCFHKKRPRKSKEESKQHVEILSTPRMRNIKYEILKAQREAQQECWRRAKPPAIPRSREIPLAKPRSIAKLSDECDPNKSSTSAADDDKWAKQFEKWKAASKSKEDVEEEPAYPTCPPCPGRRKAEAAEEAKRIRDEQKRERLNALATPPARPAANEECDTGLGVPKRNKSILRTKSLSATSDLNRSTTSSSSKVWTVDRSVHKMSVDELAVSV